MAMLDQIAQQRQRLSQRLIRVDAERTKLSGQLGELEIAERALSRFDGKVVAAQKPKKGRVAKTAAAAVATPKAKASQQARVRRWAMPP